MEAADAAQAALAGHAVLNLDSTATGGGVAQCCRRCWQVRGAGIDARWLVIEDDPEFFAITKRIDRGLYGSPGRRVARADQGGAMLC